MASRRPSAPSLATRIIDSPVGALHLFATIDADQLVGAYWADRPMPTAARRSLGVLDRAAAQLDEYFAGKRTRFALPIAPLGTAFQRAVWAALCEIPRGETRSYGELARQLGRPAASRAVGAANGANPLSIIVPCHRLVGSTGALTGYAGGLAAKQWLLGLEGAQ